MVPIEVFDKVICEFAEEGSVNVIPAPLPPSMDQLPLTSTIFGSVGVAFNKYTPGQPSISEPATAS